MRMTSGWRMTQALADAFIARIGRPTKTSRIAGPCVENSPGNATNTQSYWRRSLLAMARRSHPNRSAFLTQRFGGTRQGGLGSLRDLHNLYWLRTRMKQAAPQAL